MKLVKVIMKPEKVTELRDVLSNLGYHGITSKESLGYGENKLTIKRIFRGKIYEERADAVKRRELEFVVLDDRLEKVIETIRNITKTDQGGDGRIYVSTLDEAIHIHSGDKHLGDSSEKELNDI